MSHAYFVVGDATINTDISGNSVFVGKDNATDFTTLPGSITLTVAKGANIATNDSRYYSLNVFGANIANISGGTTGNTLVYDTSVINISGGVVKDIGASQKSAVQITGGTVGNVALAGISTGNISGGMVDSAVSAFADALGGSILTISGGTLGYVGSAFGGAANISGGAIENLSGQAGAINISCGTINIADIFHSSTLNISGGSVNRITGVDTPSDRSQINISSGTVKDIAVAGERINISGGRVDAIRGRSDDVINISGGSVGAASGYDNSVFNISGGSVAEIFAYDDSVFNITGGVIGGHTIYQYSDRATTNFFGKALTFSSAMTGISDGFSGVFYDVAWTRPDGVLVDTRYFDLGGDINNPIPQGTTFTFQGAVAAPEPSAFALISVTLLFHLCVGRRKPQRLPQTTPAIALARLTERRG